MKITEQGFQNCIDYLNSIRENIWIEVEMRHKDKQCFDSLYNQYTGLTVPISSDTYPSMFGVQTLTQTQNGVLKSDCILFLIIIFHRNY